MHAAVDRVHHNQAAPALILTQLRHRFRAPPMTLMPFRSSLTALLLCLLTGLIACSPADPVDDRPGQPVAQRKKLFKQILNTLEPMGLMVRERQPFKADEFQRRARDLKELSVQPWIHFGPGTDYSPSRAKPEVWLKAAEFDQARQKFIDATNQLAEVAATGQLEKVKAPVQHVQDQCLSCHREFRQ